MSIVDQRERDRFQACATGIRELMDSGGIPGVTPSAVFVLCEMLETAGSDPSRLSAQSRQNLRSLAASIGIPLEESIGCFPTQEKPGPPAPRSWRSSELSVGFPGP